MLLDELLPRYDVVERHVTVVRAAPAAVYMAIREADLAAGPLNRALLVLRAAPAALLAFLRLPRAALAELRERRRRRGARLADFERAGFRVIAEREPEELVIGLLGRFWTPRGGVCAGVSAETFRAGPPPGHALAGWNFTVRPLNGRSCELRTETRVWCAPDARLKFRLYWLVVRPGSGLIRRAMLRAIRRRAEQGAGESMGHRALIERYYQSFRQRDRAALEELLTPDFHHVSSFGEHFNRDQMLDAIWPAVGRSWARSLQILGETPEFMVRYEIESPDRPVTRMAEYVRFNGDRIAEIEVYIGRELPA